MPIATHRLIWDAVGTVFADAARPINGLYCRVYEGKHSCVAGYEYGKFLAAVRKIADADLGFFKLN